MLRPGRLRTPTGPLQRPPPCGAVPRSLQGGRDIGALRGQRQPAGTPSYMYRLVACRPVFAKRSAQLLKARLQIAMDTLGRRPAPRRPVTLQSRPGRGILEAGRPSSMRSDLRRTDTDAGAGALTYMAAAGLRQAFHRVYQASFWQLLSGGGVVCLLLTRVIEMERVTARSAGVSRGGKARSHARRTSGWACHRAADLCRIHPCERAGYGQPPARGRGLCAAARSAGTRAAWLCGLSYAGDTCCLRRQPGRPPGDAAWAPAPTRGGGHREAA